MVFELWNMLCVVEYCEINCIIGFRGTAVNV